MSWLAKKVTLRRGVLAGVMVSLGFFIALNALLVATIFAGMPRGRLVEPALGALAVVALQLAVRIGQGIDFYVRRRRARGGRAAPAWRTTEVTLSMGGMVGLVLGAGLLYVLAALLMTAILATFPIGPRVAAFGFGSLFLLYVASGIVRGTSSFRGPARPARDTPPDCPPNGSA